METLYVNGRFLTQKISGVQRFANEILKEYALLRKSHSIVVLVPRNCKTAKFPNVEIQKIGWNISHLWEQIDLPLFLKINNNALLLNLTNTAPLFYNNNIVTIHDLAFFVNPDWFSYLFRTYYKFLIPRIAQKAQHVITVSNTMKGQLTEYLKIEEQKISVVFNAVSADFHSGMVKKKPNYERYALTVGSIDPRKNLNMLIQGFIAANFSDLKLYIIGGKNSNFNINYKAFNSRNIVFLGRVSDKELKGYYSNALFFVYLSLYEGFGIPNIEAMKMGIPVLTSNIPVMKEVCNDAAAFANPLQIEDIKEKMILLNDNENFRKILIIQGFNNQNRFSWKTSAKVLNDIIKKEIFN